ncbi:Uric acid permease PucK [Neomoorella glycerini]|uniref:Uric acid permease PucK n=1 Tax=Neomoorella glycerini TaxID=55779 RepID=A0A6I5ZRE5_9FIRM|nr:nucleobase:cation symporter-2 family protein [Moorella glycerini]QGP92572.1 Uric acid permease PucK [Moorella glycerini]
MSKNKEVDLLVGIDDKLNIIQAFVLGLQHVLAMDLYIVPIILAGLLSLDTAHTALFIDMTFIAAGIATLIQAGLGMRLPVMQGPSYVPIGALAAIGKSLGLSVMIGSLMPGALIIAVLGYPLRLLGRIIKTLIPPIVAGTVIIVVGIALMPIALESIYTAPGNVGINGLVAFISAVLLIFFVILGTRLQGAGRFIRLASVILALAGGTLFASLFGSVDFSPVAKAPWIALPRLLPFGVPVFDFNAVLTLIFIYFVVLVETTGTWFAVGAVTGAEINDTRLNGGAVGEGLGCLVGSFFGGTPVTGYSTNAGIIAITGVGSRWAIMAGGVILIILGMLPKLMNIIACIPGTVINGVFGVVCVVIAMNGFRVVRQVELDERNMLVVGLPILLTLAATLMPKDLLYSLPSLVNYLVSSGIAVGALSAVVLNLIIPPAPKTTAQGKSSSNNFDSL